MAEQPTEMVKPTNKAFDNSPLSPGGSVRGWLRSKKSTANSVRSAKSNLRSPGGASVATFDSNVVEQDKERHKEALARVYDAVYAHDESEAPPYSQSGSHPTRSGTGRPTLRNLDLDRVRSGGSQPISPRSPKSPYYAVAPPKDLLAQLSPRYKNDAPQSPMRESLEHRTASCSSDRTVDSGKLRKKLNSLNIKTISPPILRDNHDGAREPLSPRSYANPGPPPEPPSARTVETYPYTPTTPGTAVSYPFPEEEDFDEIRDLPPAHPQRISSFSREQQRRSPTSPGLPSSPAQFRVDSPSRRGQTPVGNAGNASRPLAFRQLAEQQKQAAVSNSELNLSAPPGWSSVGSPRLQTTEVYTRDRHFLAIGSAALHSPRVYTPYMPVAPPTPVTPHLTTRSERRQREKEERTMRGAITEEEQVQDEKDMWGDAY